jgi:hypothetical protein
MPIFSHDGTAPATFGTLRHNRNSAARSAMNCHASFVFACDVMVPQIVSASHSSHHLAHVTVSSLWNVIFLHRGNFFPFTHVAVRDISIRSDRWMQFNADGGLQIANERHDVFWAAVKRQFG